MKALLILPLILVALAVGVGVVWFEAFVLSTILSWFGVGLSIFKSAVILVFFNSLIVNPLRSRRAA